MDTGGDSGLQNYSGKQVKSKREVRLFHLHTSTYVSAAANSIALKLNMHQSDAAILGLVACSPRAGVDDCVCDGDDVMVCAWSDQRVFTLAKDFWFKGSATDQFRIRRFDSFSEDDSSEVRYERVCRVKADNGMLLSVKLNTAASFRVQLEVEEMNEDYKDCGELCFPELQGTLCADLVSDRDDANSYWVMERVDRFGGGKVEVGEEFYLRHVASGRYLSKDLTLNFKGEAHLFSFQSPYDDTGKYLGYGEFNCLASEGNMAGLDLSPVAATVCAQVFLPALSAPSMRLPVTMKTARVLRFACEFVEPANASVLVELAGYSSLFAEIRLALQHLRKQLNVDETLQQVTENVEIGVLDVADASHAFIANAASDFRVVSEMLRIWILVKSMSGDYAEHFSRVPLFSKLITPLQNVQFYTRVSRDLFANRELLQSLFDVDAVALAEILQWTLRAQPPPNDERLYWAEKYLALLPTKGNQTSAIELLFFIHYLLDRLPVRLPLQSIDCIKSQDSVILRFEAAGSGYFGSAYQERRQWTYLAQNSTGFVATCLEVFADLCKRTQFAEAIVQGTGLDLATCVGLFQQSPYWLRVRMSVLNFIAEVHVPGSCDMPPLSTVADSRLLDVPTLFRGSQNTDDLDWFSFPNSSSPLADLIKDEGHFWLLTSHISDLRDDPANWYYGTATRLRFIARVIEYCPVSDMFVASMISYAVAFVCTTLGFEIAGFSKLYPKLKDSKYRTETEKQIVVEECLDLLVVYRRWQIVKVLQKCRQQSITEALSKAQLQTYFEAISFQSIFRTFCEKAGLPYSESLQEAMAGSSEVSYLARNFSRLLFNAQVSVKVLLQHLLAKSHYHVRSNPTLLLDLLDHEVNPTEALLAHLGQVADSAQFHEFLPMLRAVASVDVSHYQLSTADGEVLNLARYVAELERMVDFMLSLAADDLAHYQAFLHKSEFIDEIARAWSYCIHVPTGRSEAEVFVRLRTATVELSRLYALNCQPHREQLLRVLPLSEFYFTYPQYIEMLLELHVLESYGEVANSLAQLVFTTAVATTKKRCFLSLKVLLADREVLSNVVFALLGRMKDAKKDTLTNRDWEVLTLVSHSIPAPERWWLADILTDSFTDVRPLAAALSVLSPQEAELQSALEALALYLRQTASKPLAEVESAFTVLLAVPQVLRSRNFEEIGNDDVFLLEWCFAEKSGAVYRLKEWENVQSLQQVVKELTKLHFRIKDSEALGQFSTVLSAALTEYFSSTSTELDEDLQSLQIAFLACAIPSQPPAPQHTVIPSLVPAFPFPPLTASIRLLIIDKLSTIAGISAGLYDELKQAFLPRRAEEDYLQACLQATRTLALSTDCRKEDNYEAVLEELTELAVTHNKESMQTLVLNVLEAITARRLSTRLYFIAILRRKRMYLRFLGLFDDFITRRKVVKKAIDMEQTTYKNVLLSRLESVDHCLVAFLRLFRRCCDGCYQDFQMYLRDQGEGARNSLNIVSLTASLLVDSMKQGSAEAELTMAGAEALIEMVTGPRVQNQTDVCRTPGIIAELMKQVESADNLDSRLDLLSCFTGLLLALLEGHEKDLATIGEMMGGMDFSVFATLATKLAELIPAADLRSLDFALPASHLSKQRFDLAIKCLILCFSAGADSTLSSHPLLKYVASVDIQQTDSESGEPALRTVAFPVPFIAQFLTSQTAARVLLELDRDSRHIKLEDFTQKVEACEMEMIYQQRLSRSALKRVTQYWQQYLYASFALVLAINTLLMLAAEVTESSRIFVPEDLHLVMDVLGVLQVALIACGTASFYLEYSYVLWRPIRQRGESTVIEELPRMQSPGSKTTSYLKSQALEADSLDFEEVLKLTLRCAYVLLALLSLWFEFLYPLLLAQILNLNKSVADILKSVTHRGRQLLVTLFFALIMLFAYSFVTYLFFFEYCSPDNSLNCESLLMSFLSTVNMGMRAGGGLGDALGAAKDADFYTRMTFDLLFFISITTVLMAIVFGLIVDTFSELRDEKNAMEADMNNVCLICGHTRSVIDLKGEGWEKHTLQVHNPFAYMYFLLYVKDKNLLDCSGTEKMVKECRDRKDISFYPTTSTAIGFAEDQQ